MSVTLLSSPRVRVAARRVAMFLIAALVGCVESLVVQRQLAASRTEAIEAWQGRLAEQAREHGRLIEAWVAQGLGDAEVLASFPAVRQLVGASLPPGDGPGHRELRGAHASEILGSFVRVHGFLAGHILDGDGQIVASSGRVTASRSLVEEVRAAAASGPVKMTDLFPEPSGPTVAFAVAVRSPEGGRPGHVVLLADPLAWLFPHLVQPPGMAGTEEAFLLGVRSGRPVYLTPVAPRSPVPTHAFPAARAWTVGRDRIRLRGTRDEWGLEVLGESRPIAGTPWTLALTVETSQAASQAGLAQFGGLSWVTVLGALQIGLVLALLRRRQAIHLREQRESAERLRFLNSLYLTISEVNELTVREKDRQRLLDETCRIVVERTGFRMAWVGEVRADDRVVPVAQAGEVLGYLDAINVRADDTPAGRGPTGVSIRERRTVVVNDLATDPAVGEWRTAALERGYRSSASVPLVGGEKVLGVLKVYAAEPGLLRGQAVGLMEKLAANLARALDVIELEARHRETAEALSASEEQLRQAQKMEAIGRLAGGIAHDFNNLLLVITGYADLAVSARSEDRRRRSIEEIQAAAERATELTRQLVAFSRKQVLQPKVLDLNEVVLRVESLLRRLIPENIEIRVEPAHDLRSVLADPGQMEQVLLNLALNARDAMPEGGSLTIGTRNLVFRSGDPLPAPDLAPGEYVVVDVTDTGEGMPPEVLEHLFEPFFTTKEMGKGSGLGLSMVYGIVRQSGGAVGVESEVGRGSTFRVFLPASEAVAVETSAPAVSSGPGRGHESILVVEDNDSVRGFVLQTLENAGYRVTEAASPQAALSLLVGSNGAFDLLLTDIVMPGMDGYELARRAVAGHPALRVLYMSGYADNPALREQAARTGIDLLEKPFGAAGLAAKVREVLDRATDAV